MRRRQPLRRGEAEGSESISGGGYGRNLFRTPKHPMSGSSPNKRATNIPIDRLSSLPDGVLIHILSFLGVKKAAVTSVLSKRWKFLWSQLPSLVFTEESEDIEDFEEIEESEEIEKRRRFVSMVSRALRLRSWVHLEKLAVSLGFDNSLAPDVDSWVGFVVQNKVKDFSLRLMAKVEGRDLYVLPDAMYSNTSFTRLSLRGCFMDSSRSIEWCSLTYLDIEHAELPQHVIVNVLSCCPVLHTLILEDCWGFDCLEVESRCLHYLHVHDSEDEELGPLLKISAPYVRELDILFFLEQRNFQLRNMTSLVKVRINFHDDCSPNEEESMNAAKEFYEFFLHVEDLYLGHNILKAISDLVVTGWKIPVSRRSCLRLLTFSDDEHNIAGIVALLESSPIIEKFVVNGVGHEFETLEQPAAKCELDFNLLHLKSVKFYEFGDSVFGGEPMVTVARALLKRTPVLEEMLIEITYQEISNYAKIVQTLLSCPRSSGKAVIRLSS